VGAAAASVLPCRLPSLFAEEAKKNIPIGLQLYSIRDVAPKDVAGSLAAVAKMGYQGVEFAGYYGLKAEELRKMLDDNKLKCCGTHTGIDTLSGDALKATVEYNKTLGNEFLIVPWLAPEFMGTADALAKTAKMLTDLADKVKDAGMKIGYHAHGGDFKRIGDQTAWEILFSQTGPGVVMQLDTGNCIDGGADPVAILKKLPHRSATIHLKEHGGPAGAAIGQGEVPWKDVFALCETTGDTQWYIVEHESGASPMESVRLCLENLRKMGK
jgi:sugar phosphate isomerase/epimerase